MVRLIATVTVAAAALALACDRGPWTETVAVPAFPETRERTGVAYFTVTQDLAGGFETTAHDGRGEIVGRLSAKTVKARWPGQLETYALPTELQLGWGSDRLRLEFFRDRGRDRFTVQVGDERVQVIGNPAYPARCQPGQLATSLSESQRRVLSGWKELLPDLSANVGTVQRHWAGPTFALNRASNLLAAVCCFAGDRRCCGMPPFSLGWSPVPERLRRR